MGRIKLVSASIRVENALDADREYKVSASISVNENAEITSVVSGQVYELDGNKQLAYFDSHRGGNLNYQFTEVGYETQKRLIDVIGNFIDEVRGANVTLTV